MFTKGESKELLTRHIRMLSFDIIIIIIIVIIIIRLCLCFVLYQINFLYINLVFNNNNKKKRIAEKVKLIRARERLIRFAVVCLFVSKDCP